jgi:hypothetical protein
MSFYKELQPFSEYLHSIRKLETYLSFDMKFPMQWGLPKSITEEDKVVPYDSGDANMKGISFACSYEEKEVSATITKIIRVIKLNKDKEIKEKLFKETIDSLKKTFETTDLETLKRLYFDFETEQQKPLEDGEDGTTTLELVDERTEERPKRVRPRKEEINKAD